MIPAQIPAGREQWPAGVLERLKRFRQGDVVADMPYFFWGEPQQAILSLTAKFADEGEGLVEAAERFRYGMITTQTCDIAEEDAPQPGQPWVHLCPVYNAEETYRPDGLPPEAPDDDLPKLLHGKDRSLIRKGGLQRYLWLPAIPDGCWVADLRLLIPVEKGWLAQQEPIHAFHEEADRLEVGHRLAWLHHRPAFDGRFVSSVQQPLVVALRALRKDNPELFGRLSDQVAEICVSTDTNIKIDIAEVIVLCHQQPDSDVIAWFEHWWAGSFEAAAEESLTLLPLRIEPLDQMSASEYRRLTRLPLAAVSPNPRWYGQDPSGEPDP